MKRPPVATSQRQQQQPQAAAAASSSSSIDAQKTRPVTLCLPLERDARNLPPNGISVSTAVMKGLRLVPGGAVVVSGASSAASTSSGCCPLVLCVQPSPDETCCVHAAVLAHFAPEGAARNTVSATLHAAAAARVTLLQLGEARRVTLAVTGSRAGTTVATADAIVAAMPAEELLRRAAAAFTAAVPRGRGAASVLFVGMELDMPLAGASAPPTRVVVDAIDALSFSGRPAAAAPADAALFGLSTAVTVQRDSTPEQTDETQSHSSSDDVDGVAELAASRIASAEDSGAQDAATTTTTADGDGPAPSARLLVLGSAGRGKSHRLLEWADAVEAYARGRRRPFLRVALPTALPLKSGSGGSSTAAALRGVTATAMEAAASGHIVALLLDDLDLALRGDGASGGSSTTASARAELAPAVLALCRALDTMSEAEIFAAATTAGQNELAPGRCFVAASAADAQHVPLSLRRGGRLSQHEELEIPDAPRRLALLRTMCGPEEPSDACCDFVSDAKEGSAAYDAELRRLAATMHGFAPSDIAQVVQGAVASLIADGEASVMPPTIAALARAARGVTPSSLRGIELQSRPDVQWADIGGSAAAKRSLLECLAFNAPSAAPFFAALGVAPPRGVLLYGPPGCSKTMLAKAVATQGGMNFISVKGPEVFSKWVGDSEKAVRDIFARARAATPCVVFIDELDGMCGRRSAGGSGGVADRVISQLLTELDGVRGGTGNTGVLVIAATNRPDAIDPAVLRPGRIDRKLLVGLPDERERAMIAAIAFRKVPLAPDATAEAVARLTPGRTGAEVVATCKEAALATLREDANAAAIAYRHIEAAALRVPPRVAAADVEWYERWQAGAAALA